MLNEGFMQRIEQATGVDFEEILNLANAISHADFTNERQVRKIVQKVSKLANRKITPHLEEQIVQSILQDGQSLNFSDIEKLMR